MEEKRTNPKGSGIALIPLLVFILVFVGTGVILELQGVEMAFYQMPLPIPVVVGVIVAFILFKGSIEEKFDQFIEGCADHNVLIMCIIFILAGAFSTVASAMGGVDSTVNLGLTLIPPRFITAGIFVISALIATATGTSVGTITAVVPIAVGIAEKGGLNLPLVLGAVVGGAMFGDNLSVISDTTIAATRTQNVEMRDKFRVNLMIAAPAAIITFILLLIFGHPVESGALGELSFNIVKVLPYLFVLVLALVGVNVFVVLTGGIVLAGVIGICYGDMTILSFAANVYSGFTGMSEMFIGSFLMGGLVYMTTKAGGIDFIVDKLSHIARTPRSTEVGISALVSVADIAIANNTIAILASGPISKRLSRAHKVDPRKVASLLDIWSCVWQGLVPYSAQLLICGGLAGGLIAPIEIMPFLWYQFVLAGVTIFSIIVPFSEWTIRKRPWDWEKDTVSAASK